MTHARVLEGGRFLGATHARVGAGGVSLAEIRHRTALRSPRHVHREAFFSVHLKGDYTDLSAAGTGVVAPLSVTFSPADFEHADRVGPRGASFFVISLDTPAMDLLDDGWSRRQTPGAWAGSDLVLAFLRLRAALYTYGTQWDAFTLRERIVDVLAAIDQASPLPRVLPSWVERAREHMHGVIERAPSVMQLAAEAGVHPVHFSRVFRSAFGCTPATYRVRLRVRRACELLCTTSRSISEIAIQTGFADQGHLTRAFSRHLGLPPGAFRSLDAR